MATKKATKLEELTAELEAKRERLEIAREEVRALASHNTSTEDGGDYMMRCEANDKVARIEGEISKLEAMIEREKNGTLGVCEKCGDRIDPERLKVLPETSLCTSCKKNEKGIQKGGRIARRSYV